MLKMFHSNNCPNCPRVKSFCQILESKGVQVVYFDIDTLDGLTEITYHGILTTPAVVAVDANDDELGALFGNEIMFDEVFELAQREV